MVPVIEKATVPEIVASLSAFMEIKVISSIELVQAVKNVLASMGMNDVE